MKKLLKKSKWIYFSLGILSGLIIISALFFMNQYRFVRINYNITGDNKIQYSANAKLNGADQAPLFSFLTNVAKDEYKEAAYDSVENPDKNSEAQDYIDNNEYMKIILEEDASVEEDANGRHFKYLYLDTGSSAWSTAAKYRFSTSLLDDLRIFRDALDAFNNLILIYGIVSLVCFALLLVLSNHSRRIYYKSNIVGGIVLPLVNILFAIGLIIFAFVLVGYFSDPVNNAVYNITSALQNTKVATGNINVALKNDAENLARLKNITAAFNVNPITLIGYSVFFGLTIAYNVFLMIFAVAKYKDTARERNETLEKARLVGESA